MRCCRTPDQQCCGSCVYYRWNTKMILQSWMHSIMSNAAKQSNAYQTELEKSHFWSPTKDSKFGLLFPYIFIFPHVFICCYQRNDVLSWSVQRFAFWIRSKMLVPFLNKEFTCFYEVQHHNHFIMCSGKRRKKEGKYRNSFCLLGVFLCRILDFLFMCFIAVLQTDLKHIQRPYVQKCIQNMHLKICRLSIILNWFLFHVMSVVHIRFSSCFAVSFHKKKQTPGMEKASWKLALSLLWRWRSHPEPCRTKLLQDRNQAYSLGFFHFCACSGMFCSPVRLACLLSFSKFRMPIRTGFVLLAWCPVRRFCSAAAGEAPSSSGTWIPLHPLGRWRDTTAL